MARPRKYPDPKDFLGKTLQYFQECDDLGKPYLITGYCLYMGVCRDTMCEYEDKKHPLSDTVRLAKLRIAAQCEQRCIERGNAGDIFLLKNHGFRDRQEIEQTGEGGGPMVVSWGKEPKIPKPGRPRKDQAQAKIRLVK